MAKNSKTTDKLMNIGKAAAGGAAAKFITSKGGQMLKNRGVEIDSKIIAAAPLIGSFFLLDVKGMEAAAYGMAGTAGAEIGHEFGIFDDINGDDINGIFIDDPEDIKRD